LGLNNLAANLTETLNLIFINISFDLFFTKQKPSANRKIIKVSQRWSKYGRYCRYNGGFIQGCDALRFWYLDNSFNEMSKTINKFLDTFSTKPLFSEFSLLQQVTLTHELYTINTYLFHFFPKEFSRYNTFYIKYRAF
jgi:hypothetical protein